MLFKFIHDNNIELTLSDELTSKFNYQIDIFDSMISHEKIFRNIIIELINLNIIDRNKNFIDLGGYVGDNSLPWAKNIDGIVYCIEPSKINIEFINELLKHNAIKNVTLFNICISDKEETLSTNGSIDIGHNVSFVYDKKRYSLIWNKNENKIFKLKSTTLDILYENKDIDNITFIHIDVEGMELLVLNGSKNIISIFKPVIVFEVHLKQQIPDKNELVTFFIERDYIVYIINEVCGRKDCRNFLAIPTNINDIIMQSTIYKNLILYKL